MTVESIQGSHQMNGLIIHVRGYYLEEEMKRRHLLQHPETVLSERRHSQKKPEHILSTLTLNVQKKKINKVYRWFPKDEQGKEQVMAKRSEFSFLGERML